MYRRSLRVLFPLLIIQLMVKAQVINNLVVFCNDGERFTLILNGLKENSRPETNVRVEGLDLKVYEVKVIFENPKLKDVNTTLTFYRTNKECVFALNKKGSKKHTMDYVSEKDIIPQAVQPSAPVQASAPSYSNAQAPATNISTPAPSTPTVSPFQALLDNILAQVTESGKLNTANAALEVMTFSLDEIKQILPLFASDQTRLAFAKQVYTKIKDPSFYQGILDTFINAAIKDEFTRFAQGK